MYPMLEGSQTAGQTHLWVEAVSRGDDGVAWSLDAADLIDPACSTQLLKGTCRTSSASAPVATRHCSDPQLTRLLNSEPPELFMESRAHRCSKTGHSCRELSKHRHGRKLRRQHSSAQQIIGELLTSASHTLQEMRRDRILPRMTNFMLSSLAVRTSVGLATWPCPRRGKIAAAATNAHSIVLYFLSKQQIQCLQTRAVLRSKQNGRLKPT